MKPLLRWIWPVWVFTTLIVVLILPRQPPAARGAWVNVTSVVDGDTIYVDGKTKVRLKCIDTPETVDIHKPDVECYGPEASAFTKEKLTGRRVRLEHDPVDSKVGYKDRFGRELAYVYLEDQTLFNLELAQLGYGRTTHWPCSRKKEFKNAVAKAREAGLGRWGKCKCVGKLVGNSRSHLYHRPDQEHYNISDHNRVCFNTEEEAKAKGYRPSER